MNIISTELPSNSDNHNDSQLSRLPSGRQPPPNPLELPIICLLATAQSKKTELAVLMVVIPGNPVAERTGQRAILELRSR